MFSILFITGIVLIFLIILVVLWFKMDDVYDAQINIENYGSLKSSSWHKVLGYRVHIPSNVIPSNLG